MALRPSEDIEAVVAGLVAVGYVDRGYGDGGVGRLLVWESAPDVRTMHVHLTRLDSGHWRRDVAFRDALRADVGLRERYGGLKTELARRFADDRRSYREAKNGFITEALAALAPCEG